MQSDIISCPICQSPLDRYELLVDNNRAMPIYPMYLQPCGCAVHGYEQDGDLIRWHYAIPKREEKSLIDQGFNSFIAGIQECENPYPGWWQREKYNEWQEGWSEAKLFTTK